MLVIVRKRKKRLKIWTSAQKYSAQNGKRESVHCYKKDEFHRLKL